jgi:hypothetical protein
MQAQAGSGSESELCCIRRQRPATVAVVHRRGNHAPAKVCVLTTSFPAFQPTNQCLLSRPRYTAELTHGSGEATLSFVEANSFRNLVHLTLRLGPGNDASVKEHLAACLHVARGETASVRAELRAVTTEATAAIAQLEAVRCRRVCVFWYFCRCFSGREFFWFFVSLVGWLVGWLVDWLVGWLCVCVLCDPLCLQKLAEQVEKITLLETQGASSLAQLQQRYTSEVAHLTDAVHRADAELKVRSTARVFFFFIVMCVHILP